MLFVCFSHNTFFPSFCDSLLILVPIFLALLLRVLLLISPLKSTQLPRRSARAAHYKIVPTNKFPLDSLWIGTLRTQDTRDGFARRWWLSTTATHE
jgi:hypothetical protein